MQCAVADRRSMRNGPKCVSADGHRMQKALFIQSQKTVSWPTIPHWTFLAFFIRHLVQNVFSLSLYKDHTLRICSECILGSLPFSLSVSRIFSCCISHGHLPRQKSIKHPSRMLLHVPVFWLEALITWAVRLLDKRTYMSLIFFQNAV